MHAADVDGGKTLNFFDVDNSLHEKGVPGNTVDTLIIGTINEMDNCDDDSYDILYKEHHIFSSHSG